MGNHSDTSSGDGAEGGGPSVLLLEALYCRTVEDAAALERLAAGYKARADFGNVISRDNAKELFYSTGQPQERTRLNEAASAAAKTVAEHVYARRLAEEPGPERVVVLTGGGTGSGKTTVAMRACDEVDLIFDSQSTDPADVRRRIAQTIATGRGVERVYVYRGPVDAWIGGVLPRAAATGRPVSIEGHVASHRHALWTAITLTEEYAGDPEVSLSVIDNASQPARCIPASEALAFLRRQQAALNEDDVRAQLQSATDHAHSTGLITDDLYAALTGGCTDTDRRERPARPHRSRREGED